MRNRFVVKIVLDNIFRINNTWINKTGFRRNFLKSVNFLFNDFQIW
jgi:hypothetical protein